ncbi:MAG TPA: ATP-binding protein [Anaerolineales bacterium]|nr:ATP-binding protein [Anaerolineales bacterium]
MIDKLISPQETGSVVDHRALFEQSGECLFIIGPDLKFITANHQALHLIGYEESQLSGMPLEEIIPLGDAHRWNEILENRADRQEVVLRKKDDTLLPAEISTTVVTDATGEQVYIQLLARDISEQKNAQLALKRHIRALAVIGETTAGLVRSPDIQATIPEVLESLGYAVDIFCCALFNIESPVRLNVEYQWLEDEAAEFKVQSALYPFLEEIASSPTRVFSTTGAESKLSHFPLISILVIPIQGVNGSWGFLGLFDRQNQLSWLTNEFDTIQTTANLIGAALERLHYEETIRLSEVRNRVLVDALPDLLLRVNLAGYILDYNAHPTHPLYVPRDSVIGKNLHTLWPENVTQMIFDTEENDAFASSHWVHGFTLPDHEEIFEARLHPISENQALIVVRDITEQARLDRMKSDFINRASHELRTPLTGAILMAELMQRGIGTKEEMDEYLRVLLHELNRQKELINQLLLAGRLESGGVKLEAIPMNLLPVLDDSVLAVQAIANKRNISIKVSTDEILDPILGDKGGLSQVFINLISNAVKFSPEGNAVEVVATMSEKDAVVSIADHGLGIPPDAIPHLFERFYRAKNVTVAEIPGSGIGLYIVKSIVDELGGMISVASEVNHGTTFTVRLRKATEQDRT